MANCEQVAMRPTESSETYLATFDTCTHEKSNMMHRNEVIWAGIVLNTPETTITSFGAIWINMYRTGGISMHCRTKSIYVEKGKHATMKRALAVERRCTAQHNHVSTKREEKILKQDLFLQQKQR